MAEVHDHAITMTFMARGGRHAAVLAADVRAYVLRQGGTVTDETITPGLTTEERESAQVEVLERDLHVIKPPRVENFPQTRHQKNPGESEADFSERMARVQSEALSEKKAQADAEGDDPIEKFKGVFGG
jgi:hypothetical protein